VKRNEEPTPAGRAHEYYRNTTSNRRAVCTWTVPGNWQSISRSIRRWAAGRSPSLMRLRSRN